MPTIAELTAQMIALQAQQQAFRTTTASRLRAASLSSPYGTQATRDRLAQWATRIDSGEAIPLSEIDQFNTSASLNPEWIYFGAEPNYSGLSGTQIGAMNAQLRNQYRTQYQTYLSTGTQLDVLREQIDAINAELENGAGPGTGTGPGPGPGPGGGGTPGEDGGIGDPTNPNNASGVPTKPSPRLPEEGRRATADRPRMDRRRLNIAFGAPRVGVGINIPSY